MKTNLLDLNAYGVEEMSVAEMQMTEGGIRTLLRDVAYKVLVDIIAGAVKSAAVGAYNWAKDNMGGCLTFRQQAAMGGW